MEEYLHNLKKCIVKIRSIFIIVFAIYGMLTPSKSAEIITFDDLYVSGGILISNPYNGLDWNNFQPAMPNWFNTPNGFVNALLSGDVFAYNLPWQSSNNQQRAVQLKYWIFCCRMEG